MKGNRYLGIMPKHVAVSDIAGSFKKRVTIELEFSDFEIDEIDSVRAIMECLARKEAIFFHIPESPRPPIRETEKFAERLPSAEPTW